MSVTVLIADDHPVVRDGLRLILEKESDIKVVGEAATGREAVKAAKTLKPDIVLMDIAMPEMNGIEAASSIVRTSPQTRVIVLSVHSTAEHVYRALKEGVSGYILKESAGNEVIRAVRSVARGKRFWSAKIGDQLVESFLQHHGKLAPKSPLESLSPRERETLQLVVEGKTSVEIAEFLHLSPKSVETYRSRIMKKLGVKDLPALVKFALQHGLTKIE